jgi:hypothetical protein
MKFFYIAISLLFIALLQDRKVFLVRRARKEVQV